MLKVVKDKDFFENFFIVKLIVGIMLCDLDFVGFNWLMIVVFLLLFSFIIRMLVFFFFNFSYFVRELNIFILMIY